MPVTIYSCPSLPDAAVLHTVPLLGPWSAVEPDSGVKVT